LKYFSKALNTPLDLSEKLGLHLKPAEKFLKEAEAVMVDCKSITPKLLRELHDLRRRYISCRRCLEIY